MSKDEAAKDAAKNKTASEYTSFQRAFLDEMNAALVLFRAEQCTP
jgi:hypothetical protein